MNRWLAVAAIVLTLLLAELAARAFAGHARQPLASELTVPAAGSTAPRGTSGVARRTIDHARPRHGLRAPAHPPRAAPASAPTPVVSGGS